MSDDRDWRDLVIEATRGQYSQLGTILLAVLDRQPDCGPRFDQQATVTSDGFIMCGYLSHDQEYHHGAFVGALDDLMWNVLELAVHCNLTRQERLSLYGAVKAWLVDWHGQPANVFTELQG